MIEPASSQPNNLLLAGAPSLTPVLPLTTGKLPGDDGDNDVSDISGDEDFPAGGNDGQNSDTRKRLRILWAHQKEEYLLRCYNHYRLTCWNNHGLKGKSWRRIAVRMSQEFQEEYDSKSCRNKLNVLRYEYYAYLAVMTIRKSGLHEKEQDLALHALFEKNNRASKWKEATFPHAELMRRILDENGDGVEPVPELDYIPEPPLHSGKQSGGPGGVGATTTPARKRMRVDAPEHHHGVNNNGGNIAHHAHGPHGAQQGLPYLPDHMLLPGSQQQQQQQQLHSLAHGIMSSMMYQGFTPQPLLEGPAHASLPLPNTQQPPQSQQSQQQQQQMSLEDVLGRVLDRVAQGFDDVLGALRSQQTQQTQGQDSSAVRQRALEALTQERFQSLMSDPAQRYRLLAAFKDTEVCREFLIYPEVYREAFLQDLLNDGYLFHNLLSSQTPTDQAQTQTQNQTQTQTQAQSHAQTHGQNPAAQQQLQGMQLLSHPGQSQSQSQQPQPQASSATHQSSADDLADVLFPGDVPPHMIYAGGSGRSLQKPSS